MRINNYTAFQMNSIITYLKKTTNRNRLIPGCLVALTLVLSISCSLDEEVYDFITTENFYKTEDDAYDALTAAYDVLGKQGYYERYFFYIACLPSEELTLKLGASGSDYELDQLSINDNNAVIEEFYSTLYLAVCRANAVIDRVPAISMDSVSKATIIGEARFLRALHYFNLVRVFGAVPLVENEVSSLDSLQFTDSTIPQIFDFIIGDLKYAESALPAKNGTGRASQGAAKSLLAKVYLFLGSAHYFHSPKYDFADAETYYALARDKAKEVIDNSSKYGYQLLADYAGLWDLDKENGPEHIFSVQFDENNSEGTTLPSILTVAGPGATLADGTQTGVGWGHCYTEKKFYETFHSMDTRRDKAFITNLYSQWYGQLKYPVTMANPWVKKYIDANKNGYTGSNNFPVLRYADVLLIYAEAAGPDEGLAYLNQVRTRSVDPVAAYPSGLALDKFRKYVIMERSYELCFEADRWFDLTRSNQLESVLGKLYGKTVSEKNYFFPLPQRALDLRQLDF